MITITIEDSEYRYLQKVLRNKYQEKLVFGEDIATEEKSMYLKVMGAGQ